VAEQQRILSKLKSLRKKYEKNNRIARDVKKFFALVFLALFFCFIFILFIYLFFVPRLTQKKFVFYMQR